MRRHLMLTAMLLALAVGPALAQAPKRLTGTIQSMTGDTLTMQLHNGSAVSVLVSADTRIGALVNRKLSDIKPGEFVGSAAVPGTDGHLHAQEVHIFPEAMRGTGEGHRPMDEPGQTMTNATVAEVAAVPSGQELVMKYPGGQQTIEVAPNTRIVELIPGDRGLLKPGAAVLVFARPVGDGSLAAQFIQAEKDGVKPLS